MGSSSEASGLNIVNGRFDWEAAAKGGRLNPVPNNCYELEALDPEDPQSTTMVRLAKDLVLSFVKNDGPEGGRMHQIRYNLRETLLAPNAIYRGVRNQEDLALCYVGPPLTRRLPAGIVPADPRTLYAVMLNSRQEVYLFRWIKAHANGLPREDSFGERIYHAHSTRD